MIGVKVQILFIVTKVSAILMTVVVVVVEVKDD
jgi:hypothetical protein